MKRIPVIAIFDIGKTNKKLFLFDKEYTIVFERSIQFEEILDEDGFACENLHKLTDWVLQSIHELLTHPDFEIKAINFSAYGASFVHVGSDGKPVAPLYNYLKPFPPALKEMFFHTYGNAVDWSLTTASPVLGNLNSGMQLYFLKNEKEKVFEHIYLSLHLPQYISFLLTGKMFSEITSIGCHTGLWNFKKNTYHDWVLKESIEKKMAPIFPSNEVINVAINNKLLKIGIGLHDSSSALIPYLTSNSEPFILLSTGTWCISLNPFNHHPLTAAQLENDCLCYMTYKGQPVKASRLFAGNEHEQQVKRLASHFSVPINYFEQVVFNGSLIKTGFSEVSDIKTGIHGSAFVNRDLDHFLNYAIAYHQLIFDMIAQQKVAINLILSNTDVSRIYVDGGFSKNSVYMHFLTAAFPTLDVYAAAVSQASAIGAALAIHDHWNTSLLKADLIGVNKFS